MDVLIATDFSSFNTFFQIWLATTVWNLVTIACIYLVCGLFAGWFIRKRIRIALLIPVFGTLCGLISGFFEGAVYGKTEAIAIDYYCLFYVIIFYFYYFGVLFFHFYHCSIFLFQH
jgi:hypothetical protein